MKDKIKKTPKTNGGSSDSYVVKGKILLPDGATLGGLGVQVMNKTLDGDTILGTAISTENGKYKISVSHKQRPDSNKPGPNLYVRVLDKDAKQETPLAVSPLYYNPPAELTVDIVVISDKFRPASEYEHLTQDLSNHLGDKKLSDLTYEDTKFLAGASDQDQRRIALLAQAAKLANESGVIAEIFYAFGRKDLPLYLPSLLIQEPRLLRGTLLAAVRENLIPVEFESQIDESLEKLKDVLVDKAFEEPEQEGVTSFGALVSTAVSSSRKQKAFIKRFVVHKGPMTVLWEKLAEEPEFAKEVDDLRFAVETGALTGNHLPLVKELQRRRRKGKFVTTRDVAKLDRPHWLAIINQTADGAVIGVPPHIGGENQGEKVANYVRALNLAVETAYPTAFITHRIEQSDDDEVPARTDLVTFFNQNPDFEFGRAYLPRYLTENTEARLAGVSDRKKLATELLRWDRTYRLSPHYSHIRRLLDAGFDAAHRIVRLSKAHFFTRMSESNATELADMDFNWNQLNLIYDNARKIQSEGISFFGMLKSASNQPEIPVLPKHRIAQINAPPSADDGGEGVANWETLFGSLGLCACEHCGSIHGPAAYLVDILTFINARPAENARTAKDVLFDRRPDIGRIALTCENTNTPLPYVDLVNEILEEAVHSENPDIAVEHGSPVSLENRQTFGTAEELAANPEYLYDGAYWVLARTFYPWSLPFDLGIEEGRAYLEHLGVHRYELMETFRGVTESAEPSTFVIACEYLCLTPVEGLIVVGEDDATRWSAFGVNEDEVPEDWEYWGLHESDSFTNPRDRTLTISGYWTEILARGTALVQQSGLTYDELREIADTEFLRHEGSLEFEFIDPEDRDRETCDLWHLNIKGLGEDHLTRLHRFARLWRKLGWTVSELDKVIVTFGDADFDNGVLGENTLIGIWRIQQIKAELKLSVVEVLSFWFDIDRVGDDSLYNRLFLNKAVLNPFDEAFESPDANETLTGHAPTILAALSISADELATVRGHTGLEDPAEPLTVENLSTLYHHVQLARSLKLAISEFLTLKELCGIDPFDSNSLEGTVRFIETAKKVQVSGFSIPDLDYLLRHKDPGAADVEPTEAQIGVVLAEIRDGLKKIVVEHLSEPDPKGELVRGRLTELGWQSDDIDEVIAIFDDTKVWSVPLAALPSNISSPLEETNARISFDQQEGKLLFNGVMSSSERDELITQSTDTLFHQLVSDIYDAPGIFIAQRMKAFEVPQFFTADLPPEDLPDGIVFPDDLKTKIYYDTTRRFSRELSPKVKIYAAFFSTRPGSCFSGLR